MLSMVPMMAVKGVRNWCTTLVKNSERVSSTCCISRFVRILTRMA